MQEGPWLKARLHGGDGGGPKRGHHVQVRQQVLEQHVARKARKAGLRVQRLAQLQRQIGAVVGVQLGRHGSRYVYPYRSVGDGYDV